MKTEDAIQLGALVVLVYVAYSKLAPAKSPVSTQTPGQLQPSQQVVSTPLDPDFGLSDSSTWNVSPGVFDSVLASIGL